MKVYKKIPTYDIDLVLLKFEDKDDYINLISQLTSVINVTNIKFKEYLLNKPSNQFIYLLKIDCKIAGCATLIYDHKISHDFKKVGHIEDVVIDNKYRGKGFGKILIKNLSDIASFNNCYKIILNCNKDNINFYKKCGFKHLNYEMRKDF